MRPSSQQKQSLHELKRKRRNKSPKTKRKSNTLKQRLLEYFLKFLGDNSIGYERTWWGTFIVFPHHLINKYAAQGKKPVSAFFSSQYGEYYLELMGDRLFKQIKSEIEIEKTDDGYKLSEEFISKHTNFSDVEGSEKNIYEKIFPYKMGGTYRYQVTPYMIHFLYNHQDFVDEVSFYHKKYLYNVKIEKGKNRWKKLEGKEYGTDKAVIYGENLIQCTIDTDKGLLTGNKKTPTPKWVSDKEYCSKKEESILLEILKNDIQIEKIEDRARKLKEELEEEQLLKDLLFEEGKYLENAVIKVLKLLGYKAENYDDGELGMDQIIISPEKFRYIIECEGKENKDIDITKFRQLVEAINADYYREGIEEKAFGILFGNAERTKAPNERTLDFTKKCISSAEKEGIALIKTIDLFNIAKYIIETKDEDFKKRCRDIIDSNLGKIIKFPDIPKPEIKRK